MTVTSCGQAYDQVNTIFVFRFQNKCTRWLRATEIGRHFFSSCWSACWAVYLRTARGCAAGPAARPAPAAATWPEPAPPPRCTRPARCTVCALRRRLYSTLSYCTRTARTWWPCRRYSRTGCSSWRRSTRGGRARRGDVAARGLAASPRTRHENELLKLLLVCKVQMDYICDVSKTNIKFFW